MRDFDKALELLDNVFAAAQSQNMNWFRVDTTLDPLRDDPRFKAMVAKAEARLGAAPSA
jgi:hypothetical protein